MSKAPVVFIVGVVAAAIGCGTANHVSTQSSNASVCLITAAELQKSGPSSLYDALVTVRPALLRSGVHEDAPIVVIDGAVSSSGPAILQTLSVKQVAVVRRLSAAQAASRYALYYGHPVVEVFTIYSSESRDSSRFLGC